MIFMRFSIHLGYGEDANDDLEADWHIHHHFQNTFDENAVIGSPFIKFTTNLGTQLRFSLSSERQVWRSQGFDYVAGVWITGHDGARQ